MDINRQGPIGYQKIKSTIESQTGGKEIQTHLYP